MNHLLTLPTISTNCRIALAFSGGVDSLALLGLLKDAGYCNQITAIIVNHNLRSSSPDEAQLAAAIAQSLGVKSVILEWEEARHGEHQGRQARYHLLLEYCAANEIEYLFTAHHRDDIAENLLIRLMRGSYIAGLSEISAITQQYSSSGTKITLIRPLLSTPKTELASYVNETMKLQPVQDPSNDSLDFLRNRIRKFLNNEKDCELIKKRLAKTASLFTGQKLAIEEEISKLIINRNDSYGFTTLTSNSFIKISYDAARFLLIQLIKDASGSPYAPRFCGIQSLMDRIATAVDFKITLGGAVIVQRDKHLMFYRERAMIKPLHIENQPQKILWDNRFICTIGEYQEIDLSLGKKLGIFSGERHHIIRTMPMLSGDAIIPYEKDGEILATKRIDIISFPNYK